MSFPLSFKVKDSLLKFYGKENINKTEKKFQCISKPYIKKKLWNEEQTKTIRTNVKQTIVRKCPKFYFQY